MRFLLDNISTFGGDLDSLIILTTLIVMPSFVIAASVFIYYILRYKKRRDDQKAEYILGDEKYGHKIARNILIIDVIVFLLDIVILWGSVSAWSHININFKKEGSKWYFADKKTGKLVETPKSKILEVRIILRAFTFDFQYPGPDGILDTADDIFVSKPKNELHVPVNRKIIVHLSAPDVIHSFWVKSLRFKQDAIPGREITRWFEIDKNLVDKIGSTVNWGKDINMEAVRSAALSYRLAREDYAKGEKTKTELLEQREKLRTVYNDNQLGARLFEIACAEICGPGHYDMSAWMVVDSEESFNRYMNKLIEEQKPASAPKPKKEQKVDTKQDKKTDINKKDEKKIDKK